MDRPYRDCKCNSEQMSDTDPKCIYITDKEVKDFAKVLTNIEKSSGKTKKISKYNITNAFDDLSLANPDGGIYLDVPLEVLHEFGNGIYGYYFHIFHDIFGIKKANKKEKHAIEILHSKIVGDFARQSDRSFPRRLPEMDHSMEQKWEQRNEEEIYLHSW